MALPVVIVSGLTIALGGALRAAVGWVVTALGRLFGTRLGQWVAAAMAYFGLAWATQEVVIGPVIDQLQAYMQGVSGDAVQWLGYLNFDKACSMIISAMTIRFGLAGAKAFLAKR